MHFTGCYICISKLYLTTERISSVFLTNERPRWRQRLARPVWGMSTFNVYHSYVYFHCLLLSITGHTLFSAKWMLIKIQVSFQSFVRLQDFASVHSPTHINGKMKKKTHLILLMLYDSVAVGFPSPLGDS